MLTPRTRTGPSTAVFQMAVSTTCPPVVTCRGCPTLTLSSRAEAGLVTTPSSGSQGEPCHRHRDSSGYLAAGERRQRLVVLHDVRGEHPAGFGADVQSVMRLTGWHQEGVPGVQGERGLALDHHRHRPGQDVPDLLAGVNVPPR